MQYKNDSVDQNIRKESEQNVSYEVERIVGNLVYIKGMKYPHKGLATPETISAANIIKKLVLGLLKFPLLAFYPLKKLVTFFTTIGYEVMRPYVLQDRSMAAATRTLREIIRVFLVTLKIDADTAMQAGEIISHVIEYDNAYRFRLQDLVNETTTERFVRNPRGEIKRLIRLNKERDYQIVSDKLKKIGIVLSVILLIPKYRNALLTAVSVVGLEGLQFDIADKYWACMKVDYNYFGETYEERQKYEFE